MFSCKKAEKLMSEAHDRNLIFSEKISLKFHFVLCRVCRQVDCKYKCIRKVMNSLSCQIEEGACIGEGLSVDASLKIKQKINETVTAKDKKNE